VGPGSSDLDTGRTAAAGLLFGRAGATILGPRRRAGWDKAQLRPATAPPSARIAPASHSIFP